MPRFQVHAIALFATIILGGFSAQAAESTTTRMLLLDNGELLINPLYVAPPSNTTTMNPPSYRNYLFLANTAEELNYASYPYYPSYPAPGSFPKKKLAERANKTCQFFYFDRARFVQASRYTLAPGQKAEMLSMDNDGLATVDQYGRSGSQHPTYIDVIECVR